MKFMMWSRENMRLALCEKLRIKWYLSLILSSRWKRNVLGKKILIDWLTTDNVHIILLISLRYSIRFWSCFCTIHPRFIALHSVPWPDLAWSLAAVWYWWCEPFWILVLMMTMIKLQTVCAVQQMITSLYIVYNTNTVQKRIFLLVYPPFVGSNVTVWIWPYKPILLLHYHVYHQIPCLPIILHSAKTHGYIGDLVIFNSSPSSLVITFCAWVACIFFIGCHYSSLTHKQWCLSAK